MPLTATARVPVVSIGNLARGGRGKTPVAALVARLLIAAGERPAILSRGYRRRLRGDGVVIVSDGQHVVADLDRSGDEPLLLARLAPGAAVVVHEQRAMAAAVAERIANASVHVLDDGFQHTSLKKDIDIVLVSPDDLGGRPLPFGRLRSPVSALAMAHAVIIDRASDAADLEVGRIRRVASEHTRIFHLERSLGEPVPLEPERPAPAGLKAAGSTRRVVALGGIARPERFADALRQSGWDVAALVSFSDHHRYQRRDLERVVAALASTDAAAVLTTEKDAVRLLGLRPLPFPIASVPLEVRVEPAPAFQEWLVTRVREARA